jgi:hypothetical protein
MDNRRDMIRIMFGLAFEQLVRVKLPIEYRPHNGCDYYTGPGRRLFEWNGLQNKWTDVTNQRNLSYMLTI